MRRHTGIGVLITIVSLVVSLGLLEMVLRLGALRTERFRSTNVVTIPDSNMKQPDLRPPQTSVPPKGEAFRILSVGDSFAWGFGVHAEDAFPVRLERQINQRSQSTSYEVVNWSHPGWSTIHELRSLTKTLDMLSPDLLLLSFVLNDPESAKKRVREITWEPVVPRQPAPGLSQFLYYRSRIYQMLWTGLENRRLRRALNTYYHDLFEGESWENCLWALRKIRAISAQRKIPMSVVIFPLFQGQMDDTYPYLDLHEKIRAAVNKLDVPVLDLFETYRGVDGRRLAVVPFTDAHPSELAHRLAADAILDFLVENSLVPLHDQGELSDLAPHSRSRFETSVPLLACCSQRIDSHRASRAVKVRSNCTTAC
ncbi:MAG: SGNH/GDSL hydrolase family protein [Acidobacteriota bacterium]